MKKYGSPTTVRLSDEIRAEASFIALVESVHGIRVTTSDLMLEGLQMAIDKRRSDPEFIAKVEAFNEQAQAFLQPPIPAAPLE